MGCCSTQEPTAATTLELQYWPYKKLGNRVLSNERFTDNMIYSVLAAIKEAESKKQNTVNIFEIYKASLTLDKKNSVDVRNIHIILTDLYRNDQILCNHDFNLFSLDKKNQSTTQITTDYLLCSDKMNSKYPSYMLDQRCKIVPGPNTPLYNFADLKELLLSKDLSRDADFDCTDIRFLDGKVDMTGNMVAFQSFGK